MRLAIVFLLGAVLFCASGFWAATKIAEADAQLITLQTETLKKIEELKVLRAAHEKLVAENAEKSALIEQYKKLGEETQQVTNGVVGTCDKMLAGYKQCDRDLREMTSALRSCRIFIEKLNHE